MKDVEISSDNVEPPHWLPDLARITDRVCTEIDRSGWEVGVLLCDERRITELNRDYRKTDSPTDVLTFSHFTAAEEAESEIISGDIAISLPIVESNAEDFDVPVTEEFLRVYVHALLHLAGFTHDGVDLSSQDAAEHPMLGLQERLVTAIQKELDS